MKNASLLPRGRCPDEQVLAALIEGRAGPGLMPAVDHVAECRECLSILCELRELLSAGGLAPPYGLRNRLLELVAGKGKPRLRLLPRLLPITDKATKGVDHVR